MSAYIINHKVTGYLKAALECSIYVSPLDYGLTYEELTEAAKRAGFLDGEINDAFPFVTSVYFGQGQSKLLPNRGDIIGLADLTMKEEPDYRNPAAFHFVFTQMRELVRAHGAGNAKIERDILVERGVSSGFVRADILIGVAILVINEILVIKDGIISYARGKENYGSPGDQGNLQVRAMHAPIRREARAQAYPIVKDIIERRGDRRPVSIDAFDAFAAQLEALGHGKFRMWWKQIVSELGHTSKQVSPVSSTVLSAALVEGALAFVVKHGRSLGLGLFSSSDFDRSPRTWKIDDLVNSAAASRSAPILDAATKLRAEGLIRSRQRIHAGRMLADYPVGVPDLRPEEALDAEHTARLVVRRILDWLTDHPSA